MVVQWDYPMIIHPHIEHPLRWVFLPGIGAPQHWLFEVCEPKNTRLDCKGGEFSCVNPLHTVVYYFLCVKKSLKKRPKEVSLFGASHILRQNHL